MMRIIGVSGSGSGLLLTCIVSQVFGQCLSTPITMRAGVKPGINICSYDPGDGSSTFNGVGVHAGLGMGVDFYRVLGLDFVPQYRTTAFGRDELLREHNYFYNGIMFPIHLSLKGGMIPVVSPYVGLGIGFNFLVSGVERSKYGNTIIENDRGGALQGFIILSFGAEIKVGKLRIVPEFAFNASGSGEDTTPQTMEKQYDISVGFYYTR